LDCFQNFYHPRKKKRREIKEDIESFAAAKRWRKRENFFSRLRKLQLRSGVNFINIFLAAFTRADPKIVTKILRFLDLRMPKLYVERLWNWAEKREVQTNFFKTRNACSPQKWWGLEWLRMDLLWLDIFQLDLLRINLYKRT